MWALSASRGIAIWESLSPQVDCIAPKGRQKHILW